MSSADPTPAEAVDRPDHRSNHRPNRRRRAAVLAGGVLGLVVVGGYVTSYLVAGDQVPRDASVAGVAIGGLGRADAENRLAAELGPRAEQELAVRLPDAAGGELDGVDPEAAGLGVDYAATVDASGLGQSLDPRHLWRVLTGGGPVEPVITADQAKLDATTAALAKDADRAPVDATLTVDEGRAKPGRAVTGVAVDADGSGRALRAGFLGDQPIILPAALTPPAVTDDEVAAVRRDVVDPALSGPITVRVDGEGDFALTPTMIGRGLKITTTDGALAAALDPAALRKAADSAVDDVELDEPKDATVRLRDGKPVVIPAVNGTTIAAADLAAAVEPVLSKAGEARTATVKLSGAEADRSTADAEQLGVKEVTGEFTTYFPYADYRNVNIGRAAELINNTLLEPGATFSLNEVVGERTRANGFTDGNVISNGKFRLELGGGVSQSATTTYNAMFFAGLKDVQHQPHTLFIDRYPPGREATVAWPDLDLKFTNDTDYGVLVQASVTRSSPGSQGSITVKMWSTKTYDKITSTELERSNFTTGRDLDDDSEGCQPMSPVQGFDVNYARVFSNDGKVVKTEDFFWRYAPTDRVRCT